MIRLALVTRFSSLLLLLVLCAHPVSAQERPSTVTEPITVIVPLACVVCGDGNLDAGEQCDDGNTTPGDGCAPDCTTE